MLYAVHARSILKMSMPQSYSYKICTSGFSIHNASNCSQYIHWNTRNKMYFFSIKDEHIQWLQNDFLTYFLSIKQATSENKGQYFAKETDKVLIFFPKSTVGCIIYHLAWLVGWLWD